MLSTNISVQSTLLEGYTTNGSLLYEYHLLLTKRRLTHGSYRYYAEYDYDASYTSHAHGWSTGPTSALTFYVLGLTVTSPCGQTWRIAPHPAGLSAAEGGFTTSMGWFGVKWSTQDTKFVLEVDAPKGTRGIVVLPVNGKLILDGLEIAAHGAELAMDGGQHIVEVE